MLASADDGGAGEVRGRLAFPEEWTAFAALERDDPAPPPEVLMTVPEQLTFADTTLDATGVTPVNNQYDLRLLPGMDRLKVAYVFVPVESDAEQTATVGVGADWRVQLWLNGEEIFDNTREDETQPPYPPSIGDYRVDARFREGRNVLAARVVGGGASAVLALGGPDALRAGNLQSILNDPFLMVQALH